MRVLVCAASRHGATTDIAERIFSVIDRSLMAPGGAELGAPEHVTSVEEYDAV